MLQSSSRRWITRLIFSAVLLSIPTWIHATSYDFSFDLTGGGTVIGGFTVVPDPLDDFNFIANGAIQIPEWNFSFSNFPNPNFNIDFSNTLNPNFDIISVTVAGGVLGSFRFFQTGIAHGLNGQGTPGGVNYAVNGAFVSDTIVTAVPVTIATVPEPTTLSLLATGLCGLVGYRWSQRRREGNQVA